MTHNKRRSTTGLPNALFRPAKHALILMAALLVACSTVPSHKVNSTRNANPIVFQDRSNAKEVVMYAMGMMDIGYQFGGANPESGMDCSGMVSYIYKEALGMRLPHNAQQIAELGREIPPSEVRPGDLVFFNTLNRPFSHVGIYIGDDRFIHAPSSNGKISISSLKSRYYAKRLEAARSFFY